MGGAGVLLGNSARAERIHASNNGSSGIAMDSGIALYNTAFRNGNFGVIVGVGTVLGNLTIGNKDGGVGGGSAGGAAHNVSLNSGADITNITLMDGNMCGGLLCP
jgi:hypothetical protein